jgi:hypothetical protein
MRARHGGSYLKRSADGHSGRALAPLLDDTSLHEFTGGAPLPAAVLAGRYGRLAARRSPGGDQMWGNWVIRVRATPLCGNQSHPTLHKSFPWHTHRSGHDHDVSEDRLHQKA